MQEELDQSQMEQQQGTSQFANFEDVLYAQRISFQDIKEHMTGPVISVIVHVILLSLLGSIVVFSGQSERADIQVDVTEVEIKELEKIPEPPQTEEVEPIDHEIEIERPEVTTDVNIQVEDVAVNTAATDVVMPNVLSVKPSNSALVLPGIMASRTISGRKAAIKEGGGSARTELAVLKGLRWLRDHQNADGSWGETESRKPAFTGMALLAFLAHGETPSSAEFGNCVLKAIKKIVEYSEAADPVKTCSGNGYGHMIVTYALSEAFAMTKIPMLEAHMNKMIQITINGQNTVGGFNYFYNNSAMRTDTSVVGWANQALKAAFVAGSTSIGIEQAMEKSISCMKSVVKGTRGFIYSTEGAGKKDRKLGTGTMTAAGTLVLQLLGDGKSNEAQDGVSYLLEKFNVCDWKDEKIPGGMEWALYRWYYQTQVLFQAFEGRGKEWKEWNKQFTTQLIRNQKADGRWETPASELVQQDKKDDKKEGGHGEWYFKGLDNGVYSTTLCCLMLEVYYRYLPTFKIVEAKGVTPIVSTAVGVAGAVGTEAKDDSGIKFE